MLSLTFSFNFAFKSFASLSISSSVSTLIIDFSRISPIDNETVYLLKDCNYNSQGLFEESRIIGKVQLKNNK